MQILIKYTLDKSHDIMMSTKTFYFRILSQYTCGLYPLLMCALNSGTVTSRFVIATIFVNLSLSAVGRRTSFADIFEVNFFDILTDFRRQRTRWE